LTECFSYTGYAVAGFLGVVDKTICYRFC